MDKPRPVRRVYAPEARGNGSAVDLPADEAHYLKHVLRLRVGDDVAVFDGAGREWTGRVAASGRNGVSVALDRPIDPIPEPAIRVALAIGLLKGDQMDSVVRDATMLGVAEILPMITAHVAVSRRARDVEKAIGRWRRVAVGSARQSGRAVVPHIRSITEFEAVLRQTARDQAVIATEPAVASAAVLPAPERPNIALVLVGPEGGWSREEIELALLEGARPRQLGPRTLRAESAPLVLLSALWTEWGWT